MKVFLIILFGLTASSKLAQIPINVFMPFLIHMNTRMQIENDEKTDEIAR